MRDLPVVPKQDSHWWDVVPAFAEDENANAASASGSYLFEPVVAFLHQPFELVILLIDAVGELRIDEAVVWSSRFRL